MSGIFKRRKPRREAIVSKNSVGQFRVGNVLKAGFREVLVGEVVEGIIYSGYKLKGPRVGVILAIERDHKRVDFAVAGDRIAL